MKCSLFLLSLIFVNSAAEYIDDEPNILAGTYDPFPSIYPGSNKLNEKVIESAADEILSHPNLHQINKTKQIIKTVSSEEVALNPSTTYYEMPTKSQVTHHSVFSIGLFMIVFVVVVIVKSDYSKIKADSYNRMSISSDLSII